MMQTEERCPREQRGEWPREFVRCDENQSQRRLAVRGKHCKLQSCTSTSVAALQVGSAEGNLHGGVEMPTQHGQHAGREALSVREVHVCTLVEKFPHQRSLSRGRTLREGGLQVLRRRRGGVIGLRS